MLLLPTAWRQEAKGLRREMIGCMQPLLRATDRIRGVGLAWPGTLIAFDRLVPEEH